MKTKMVFKAKVFTKNFLHDFWAVIINIIGGEVKSYSAMIEEAIQQAYDELRNKYPDVRNVRIMTSELMKGATEIIVYGEIDEC